MLPRLRFRRREYAGAYGVKTGTTDMARETSFRRSKRPHRPNPHSGRPPVPPGRKNVIAVVLGSDNDSTTTADRYNDSRALLNFALDRAS